jgi:hypothetical protein
MYVRVYSVFVFSCVSVAVLRRADHSSKELYRLRIDQGTENRPRPTRAVVPWKKLHSSARVKALHNTQAEPGIIKLLLHLRTGIL